MKGRAGRAAASTEDTVRGEDLPTGLEGGVGGTRVQGCLKGEARVMPGLEERATVMGLAPQARLPDLVVPLGWEVWSRGMGYCRGGARLMPEELGGTSREELVPGWVELVPGWVELVPGWVELGQAREETWPGREEPESRELVLTETAREEGLESRVELAAESTGALEEPITSAVASCPGSCDIQEKSLGKGN